ncbi:MucB/RseB C-terminal domain-containing protein [Pseudoalteromonas ulvae]|uniref:Anti-sigma E factor n=1 Tax=Pseudoalteromonas ulvae TaxID=107327 RepID=A0A244CSR2_PSEDV|nr:MucB/RseB C-terminal domain-containing protein [Pseudoalteromonas ulvae]OUL58631.1 anti-sigma E factor [Pseudoalteromonas ulvae]
MRTIALFLSLLFVVTPVYAIEDESAKTLLENMAHTVHQSNFDASFVVVKGNAMEPYRWRHGQHQGTELEHLSLLNGAGLEIIRINDKVTYFEPQTPAYSINARSIAGPIPDVLFHNINSLEGNYNFILGGKGRIAGRSAQLIRIESKDNSKYNYWIWLDSQSSLVLKAAYVNQQGEIVEQLQLTNVTFSEQPALELIEMSQKEFPTPLPQPEASTDLGNWQIGWVPAGFNLVKSDRHNLNLNNELADYYLFSDGLVEVSVFIQRPLSNNRRSTALTSGATTVFVHNAQGFDVSVVGNIPTSTAKSIAESVQRPSP